jgi:hypothetical protein
MQNQKNGSRLRLAWMAAIFLVFAPTFAGAQKKNVPNRNRRPPPPVPIASPVEDVRYSTEDSRPLNGAEMAALRDSLHWEPESVPLTYGGSAVSNLLDKVGRRLGSIRVQWTKTVVPESANTAPAGPAVGYFTVKMENATSCGFLGEAELQDSKGHVVVSGFDLDTWVGLGQPGSGQTIEVEGDAELPNPNVELVLKPIAVSSTLSACTTPKTP